MFPRLPCRDDIRCQRMLGAGGLKYGVAHAPIDDDICNSLAFVAKDVQLDFSIDICPRASGIGCMYWYAMNKDRCHKASWGNELLDLKLNLLERSSSDG